MNNLIFPLMGWGMDFGASSRFRRFAIEPLFGVSTKGFNRG